MPLNQSLPEEYDREAALTRKMLERVPFGSPNWQPHEQRTHTGHVRTQCRRKKSND